MINHQQAVLETEIKRHQTAVVTSNQQEIAVSLYLQILRMMRSVEKHLIEQEEQLQKLLRHLHYG